jgi:hypothetical protein
LSTYTGYGRDFCSGSESSFPAGKERPLSATVSVLENAPAVRRRDKFPGREEGFWPGTQGRESED